MEGAVVTATARILHALRRQQSHRRFTATPFQAGNKQRYDNDGLESDKQCCALGRPRGSADVVHAGGRTTARPFLRLKF